MTPNPIVVSVAGLDGSGGAGVLADTVSIQSNGARAMSVVTAVIPQNSSKVVGVTPLSTDLVGDQLEALGEEFDIGSIKVGLLPSVPLIETLCDFLDQLRHSIPVVVDPVLSSTTGALLVQDGVVECILDNLIPRATLITPNVHEVDTLLGLVVSSVQDAIVAGERMLSYGSDSVLVKGGHLRDSVGTDVWVHQRGYQVFSITAPHSATVRGTGCMFSSAIATHLAHGSSIATAIRRSRAFIHDALHKQESPGQGTPYSSVGVKPYAYAIAT